MLTDDDERSRRRRFGRPQRNRCERSAGADDRCHELSERDGITVRRFGEDRSRRERRLHVRDRCRGDGGDLTSPLTQKPVLVAVVHTTRADGQTCRDQHADHNHDNDVHMCDTTPRPGRGFGRVHARRSAISDQDG